MEPWRGIAVTAIADTMTRHEELNIVVPITVEGSQLNLVNHTIFSILCSTFDALVNRLQ